MSASQHSLTMQSMSVTNTALRDEKQQGRARYPAGVEREWICAPLGVGDFGVNRSEGLPDPPPRTLKVEERTPSNFLILS